MYVVLCDLDEGAHISSCHETREEGEAALAAVPLRGITHDWASLVEVHPGVPPRMVAGRCPDGE